MRVVRAGAIGAAIVACLGLASTAAAKDFVVTKLGDPVPKACKPKNCSLREAVIAANKRPGPDRILLPERKRAYQLRIANSVGTEDLAREGDLDLLDDVTILHPGKGFAKLNVNGIDRAFELLKKPDHASATIKKLIIRGGLTESNQSGGAIVADDGSSLAIIRSRFVGNEAGRHGGAIAHYGARLRVVGTKVVGNVAGQDSGAIDISAEGPALVKNSTLSGNRGGATGGAGYLYAEKGVSIIGTTASGNSIVGRGGGFYVNSGPVRITNSTITANKTDAEGGGIYNNDGSVLLNAVTVARNSSAGDGGGLYNATPGYPFEVRNSLIALNNATGAGDDCANGVGLGKEFDSLGNNLLSTRVSCLGFDHPRDLERSQPKLGNLMRNGGPTQTIALLKGSPAIGKAHKPSAPKRDQRGRKRDRKPDIGAFER